MLSITVEAKSCDHDYGNADVCNKCGHLRVHPFESSITFLTYKENVPIWSQPTKFSQQQENIVKKDTPLNINGILRNNYGNIWLRLTNNRGYVYVENVYLCLEILAMQNYQSIWHGVTKVEKLAIFYNLVQPNGSADYKHWLDPSNKGIMYNVKINSKFYQMTAESFGNIHYGFLGRLAGINDNALLYAGGAVNIATNFNKLRYNIPKLVSQCVNSYCDESSDVNDVKSGIQYFNTGVFWRR